jgi:aminodeoxyfutalosine deaminase
MTLSQFIAAAPKAELHVHLQGATRPETLLKLAKRNRVELPADDIVGLRRWYTFRDFDHFNEIYDIICECFCSSEDLELAAREFIEGQAAQNIRYTEVTYTPNRRMPFDEQMDALNAARVWGQHERGTLLNFVIDIPREVDADTGLMIAEWALQARDRGVVAFGLGGPEFDNPPEKFQAAFDLTNAAGLPAIPHAGETVGPESIWPAIEKLKAVRIGHGVRCLEDPALVDLLRERQIPLEVCPTSNVLLGVCHSLESHPLPHLLDAGLYITINTDDPPMFNTSLIEEYRRCAETFELDAHQISDLILNAFRVSFLPSTKRDILTVQAENDLHHLRHQYGL